MKLTTIIALLAANFMVANAASTMNRIVIDLSNSDDSPSFHNDADILDGPGSLDTDNLANSYDVDGFSDNFPSFFNGLADEPDELEMYNEDCYRRSTGRGGSFFPLFLFENKCLLVSARPNGLFMDYTQNCCGQSSWFRVNTDDWDRVLSQGDLDGLRFQYTYFKDGTQYIPIRKVTGNKIAPMRAEEFFS